MATLNIHWGRDAGGARFDVVKACAALDADVIALQEQTGPPGGPSLAARLAAELGYQFHETTLSDRVDDSAGLWVGSSAPSGGTWGLAVLSRIPIVSAADASLGQARRDPERLAQVVLLAACGSSLQIVNTHLANRALASLRQLNRFRQLLAGISGPTIALGDFNLPRRVVAAVTRCVAASSSPTWPARRPLLQLDNVLARDCAVTAATVRSLHVGSDHRAVLAEVRLPR